MRGVNVRPSVFVFIYLTPTKISYIQYSVCENIVPVWTAVNGEEQSLGRAWKVSLQDGKRINEEKEGEQGDKNAL